jgi:hypothetical protein
MYKERDEDKAERNFKNSKSVSAAYRVVRPRIDLLESREKQKPDDVDLFLSLPFKMLKKKFSRKRRNLKFQGTLFPFINILLDEGKSEAHGSNTLTYSDISNKYLRCYKPVQHMKGKR